MTRQNYYSQMSVDELVCAAAKAKKEKKYEPVQPIDRRKICTSWWGQAWCRNMEMYSDYENRLPRGKRYVRAGAVVDLKIEKGKATARVQGTRAKPYRVEIEIEPVSEKTKQEILKRCEFGIHSLECLANGDFPNELQDLFQMKNGLFPSPQQIHFHCSCPDWAYMCKHVAAALYGIGVRLDENPFLFFTLRDIDPHDLIEKTIGNKLEAMLKNASRPSKRILHEDPDDLFGL